MRELTLKDAQFGVVQVRTLLMLRWLAILGQLSAILFVVFVLEFEMPAVACLTLVGLSAWSNVFLRIRFANERRLPESWATGIMAFDICQLALQLGLTGGLTNPFCLMLIAPVMVSATTLQADRTAALGALVVVLGTLLGIYHLPLPWYPGEHFAPPFLFIGGMWISLIGSLTFMGTFAFRVAEERRQLADALAATELVLTRVQHLQALDGLAAAAAHELGTPLSTITVVAREMERELSQDSPLFEDVLLLREQTERCRTILGKLKSLGEDDGSPLDQMSIRGLLEEVVEDHRGTGVEIAVSVTGDEAVAPVIARNPAIHFGLSNLVENAVEFAETLVTVHAEWTVTSLTITISDDGPGFPEGVLERLGDPFVSERDGGTGGGLGLGIFIAKTLLERTGAKVNFERGEGATSTMSWPRELIVRPAAAA